MIKLIRQPIKKLKKTNFKIKQTNKKFQWSPKIFGTKAWLLLLSSDQVAPSAHMYVWRVKSWVQNPWIA